MGKWSLTSCIMFFAANIGPYLYPFISSVDKTRPLEHLRLTALGVIGTLVKVLAICFLAWGISINCFHPSWFATLICVKCGQFSLSLCMNGYTPCYCSNMRLCCV